MNTRPASSSDRVLLATGLVLASTSAYLAARSDASPWYFAAVVLHPLAGIVAAWLVGRHAARAWAQASLVVRVAAVLFGAAAVTGAVLAVAAFPPIRTYARLPAVVLSVHVAFGGATGLAALATLRSTGSKPRAAVLALVAVLFVLSPGARLLDERFPPQSPIRNPDVPPATMDGEGHGAGTAFFPSSAETPDGGLIPAQFFMTSEECGRCHTEIYEQWRSSMHHFSSFNNQWYRKSIEYMQDVVGTTPSKWCAGCHDHAMLFSGTFDRPARDQIDTPEAQAGLGCVSCHAIVHVKSTMGQADFLIEAPPLHELASSPQPLLRFAHDYLLYLDPVPHRRVFLKSFHREDSAEFCASCHKVHLDVPVNDYRWIRGFNEYDNWQASGVSGQGARSFYYPEKPKACFECHMPEVPSTDPAARNGKVRSHRFPGANTAVPFVNGDETQLQTTTAFLRAGQVTIDIFGFVRGDAPVSLPGSAPAGGEPRLSSTFAVGEESMPIGGAGRGLPPGGEVTGAIRPGDASVRRGESVRLEVVVRTRNVGHFFPGGTVDAGDVWVELEAVDSSGRTLLHSGGVGDDGRGPIDPSAHQYRSLMLDGEGLPINKRNAWMTRTVAYVRLIPPGAADTVHYRLEVPSDAADAITIRARLRYRKFAWWLTQWSYAGVRDPGDTSYSVAPAHDTGRWVFTGDTSHVSGAMKSVPDLPIVTMAEAETTLRVVPATAPVPSAAAQPDTAARGRWNDYGIGLLLQGDLRGAESAFLEVTRLDASYPDGWVNVARARLQEGAIAGAEEALASALALAPDLARAHFLLGVALKGRGAYPEALEHLRRAGAQYPRDRVVLNQIGRVLFLQGRFTDAVDAFRRVLAIDPEDLQAHYNLMLCYQGLGDGEKSAEHEALYRRFKADEASQALTGPYRQLHPYDNNERQAVHEHRSPGGES